MRINRRSAIVAGAIALAGLGGLSAPLLRRIRLNNLPPWAREIVAAFDPDDTSRNLGRLYLEESSANRQALLVAIDTTKPVAWLQDKVSTDLRDGRTLFLGGWVVAETEAELSAWLYLNAFGN